MKPSKLGGMHGFKVANLSVTLGNISVNMYKTTLVIG